LLVHCVSRPEHENFADFFYDYRSFHAHCVSRRTPGYFGQRIPTQRLADHHIDAHTLAKAALAVVVRVLLVPSSACATMTLAPAAFAVTRTLSLACMRVRLKPLAANPARPLARHPLPPDRGQRGATRSRGYASAERDGWVISREHHRVICRERRRSKVCA